LDATAFAHRKGTLFCGSVWSDAADTQKRLDDMQRFYASLQPYMSGGAYVNYCDFDLPDYATALVFDRCGFFIPYGSIFSRWATAYLVGRTTQVSSSRPGRDFPKPAPRRAPESAFPQYSARSLQRFISMGTFDDPARVIVRLPRVTTHVMAWQLLRRGCCRSCLALRSLQSIEQNYACDGTKERRNGCHIKEHLCRHC
jgi:hypothetical protein